MRWVPLARKEARAVASSKGVWLLAVLLVPLGYRPNYVGWDALGPNITAGYVQMAGSALLPLGVLLLSYRSIVGERTSGSVKIVLGLPLTRTDVLIGKVLGRTAGIAGPVSVAFLVLAVVGIVDHGVFDPLVFLGTVVLTLLHVGALVSVAVSISAVVSRGVTAVGTVLGGIYFPFVLFWELLSIGLFTGVTGTPVDPFDPPASGPLFFLLRLSPGGAYRVVSNWILGVGNSPDLFNRVLTKFQPQVYANAYVVEATFPPESVPFYLHEAFSLLVLPAWIVVPLGLARYRFTRGDVV
ncbi:ABC transporter permease subunit [Salinirubellus sp. GCM10025818]|uniref:ABC transporter permease subunit n=1 Tax=Salinirubellus TaxID=2162630 RepID=UPI0030CDEE33